MEEYKELTLKDIILEVQSIFKLLLGKWWVLLLGAIIGGVIYGFVQYQKPDMYSESLTFMMDEKAGNDVPGLELLGSLFGGGSGGGDNLGKILELFESKKIVHETLMQPYEIKGKTDYIANHMFDLIGIEDMVEEYKKFGFSYCGGWTKQLKENVDFRFSHSEIDSFSRQEILYLRLLFNKINGNDNCGIPLLLSSHLDAETSIMTISMTSDHEDITLAVINNIYEQLSEFFIEKTVEKQKKTYDIVSMKRDSILGSLKIKEYALANFKDKNRKLVTVKGYLDQLRLERDVMVLNAMYVEVVKQMEATDFALRNRTPVVQIIDKPRSPIIPTSGSPIFGLVLGGILGVILIAGFLIMRTYYKKVMA